MGQNNAPVAIHSRQRASVGVLVASHGIDTCFRHPDKLTLPSPGSGASSAWWPNSAIGSSLGRLRGDAPPCSGPTNLHFRWLWLERESMASLPWPHVGGDSMGSDLWRTLIPTVLHSIDTVRCPPLPGVIVYHTTTSAGLYSITDWWCSECDGQWRPGVDEIAAGWSCVGAWVRAFSIERAFFESLLVCS